MRYARDGYEIVLVGHRGHVEVDGTLGHAPERMHLVETVEDVAKLAVRPDPPRGALYATLALGPGYYVGLSLLLNLPRRRPAREGAAG